MNENDAGTRSFEPVSPEPPQKKPAEKPDLKKIITISIFAVMTAIILLFCGIIIAEVAYKIGADVKYTVISVASSEIKSGELLLVNKANPLDAAAVADANAAIKDVYDYNSELKKDNPNHTVHYTYGVNRDGNIDLWLRAEVIDAFNLMTNALFDETGCGDIMLAYAHMVPKESTLEIDYPHQLGTVVDIKLSTSDGSQALSKDPTAYNWFVKNAHKFGFVNSDPSDSVHGTDELVPSTQFRYIGVAHATYIYENEKVNSFEQYVAELKNSHNDPSKAISVEVNEAEYMIYYVPSTAGDSVNVKVPENYEYTVSGDNVGGFIVTVSK